MSIFFSQIKDALERATFDSNSQVGIIFHEMDAIESPPTYFRTNRFTNAFQEIVDAYGFVLEPFANKQVKKYQISLVAFHIF